MNRHSLRWLLLLLLPWLLTACAPVITTPAAGDAPAPSGVTHRYHADDQTILNPERGFFTPYELPGPAGFSPVRLTGNTLVHLNIRLDEWRERDLPPEVLAGLGQNFADIRAAGVKAILRVAYNQGPYPDSEPDAAKAQILRHIAQLQPLFEQQGDVIAWVEAGFIGAWGEWHTSTHGLDNLADKQEILTALLAALPANRMVQVRYPANIIELYPDPLDAAAARVAHHNDCFLSSATDVGTYERDGTNTIERDQAYLAVLTQFTPMSGESCAPNPPRSECDSALAEMALLHVSALNEAYHKGILRSWKKDGCLEAVEQRLGYRLALSEATFPDVVQADTALELRVELENSGFAAPVNPRPLYALLVTATGAPALTVLTPVDPRDWQPGAAGFTATLPLPADLAPGAYTLALWLPDEAATLQADPRYALRFANVETWDETTGYNRLGTVRVEAPAP